MAILQSKARALTSPRIPFVAPQRGMTFELLFFTSLPDTEGGDGNPPDNNYSPEDTQRYCVAGYDAFIINFPTRD